jgi:tetratricopeptide (TPR) repeat protein
MWIKSMDNPVEAQKGAVFLSYAHEDRERALELVGLLDERGVRVWWDRELVAGDHWPLVLEVKLRRAQRVIVLWSRSSVRSEFVKHEAQKALHLNKLVPILIDADCTVPNGFDTVQAATITDLRQGIEQVLQALAHDPLAPLQIDPLPPPQPRQTTSTRLRIMLPGKDGRLFGRDAELERLHEAWSSRKTNVVTLTATGGTGKTSLLHRFIGSLADRNFDGATHVLAWSAYDEGSHENSRAAADAFFDQALEFFGKSMRRKGRSTSQADKALELAEAVQGTRALLILDGVEPLQNKPVVDRGRFREKGVAALVSQLARQNAGMCLITSRQPIEELSGESAPRVLSISLDRLDESAGVQLLSYLGVESGNAEKQALVQAVDGHALSLNLVGAYIERYFDGDGRRWREALSAVLGSDPSEDLGLRSASRIMESYVRLFESLDAKRIVGGGGPERDLLHLLGLFDRPVTRQTLDAVIAGKDIPGLSTILKGQTDQRWAVAVQRLRECRLIAPKNPVRPNELDAHPLVRSYFGQRLQRQNLAAWREANRRLYEHYKGLQPIKRPDTLAEMEPLFCAIQHGCAAGLQQKAWDEVYWPRISRQGKFYITSKLAAYGQDLAVLANFFSRDWQADSVDLPEDRSQYVLALAGMRLRAIGRLDHAEELLSRAVDIRRKLGKLGTASNAAELLSETRLVRGKIPLAIETARQALAMAEQDQSEPEFKNLNMMKRLSMLGDALHQHGNLIEANDVFRRLKSINDKQARGVSGRPFLYSVVGFRRYEHLITQGNWDEVIDCAKVALESTRSGAGNMLATALHKLLLGRAYLQRKKYPEAAQWLEQAVDGLRTVGMGDYLARALLARARLRLDRSELADARRDITEATEICHDAGFLLLTADCYLAAARLDILDRRNGSRTQAELRLREAAQIIGDCGYRRRDDELAELRGRLSRMPASAA